MNGSGRVTTMKGALALVFLAALAAAPAAAGDMTPDFGPNAAGSRMKTLDQIWYKLTTGTVPGTAPDPARPFTGADISFGGSMHDLNQIFNALPASSAAGAVAADVCRGLTYWGLTSGAWGSAAGTRDCTGPVLTNPGNQTIVENGSLSFALAVTEETTPLGQLSFVATSGNAALLPVGAIAFAWNPAPAPGAWNVTLTPVAHVSGSSTLTIQAIDQQGNRSAAPAFTVTVTAVNQQPTISAIADQATSENVPTSVIPFFVSDDHTAAGSLAVTASSSDPAIVPNLPANLVLGGSGANRTIKVVPATNVSGGPVTITITVTDGASQSGTETFALTLAAVNQGPTAANVSRAVSANATIDVVVGANFSDLEDADADLSLHVVAPLPAKGTADVAAGPKITYAAGAAPGADTVTYAVCDTQGVCDLGTVSVTVNP